MFLIVVDAFSNWAEVEVIQSTKSTAIINCLRSLFATHGLPDVIVSDNGTAFMSAEMKEFLKFNAINFIYTAPYHPAHNCRAKKRVREFKAALKKQIKSNTQCKIS